MSEQTGVVVIGAGHAGLAASHFLAEHDVDHVVLERGVVANSWRTERWDSLRLLTPNWLAHLPGHPYDGGDPDGFMTAWEVADHVASFAKESGAPVRTSTTVLSVRSSCDGYLVVTDNGTFTARAVVIASGACNRPVVPAVSAGVPSSVRQVTPFDYRSPDDLPDGGVLVVGASATGVQLADELHRSGRPVTLSVGEHVRLPRTHRGRDVAWWMHHAGVWAERYDEVDDLQRARRLPSPQLVGGPTPRTLDLNALTAAGVELVGRLATIRDGHALFSGGLRNVLALADLKQQRLLTAFDQWAARTAADVGPVGEHPEPTRSPATPRLRLDLTGGEIATVVWATGYRPDYSWLDVPVVDGKGRLRHDGGIVDAPGLYALGLPVLRRRGSTFLHGIEDDAREVIGRLVADLARHG
ncbi:MAG TPA: NAD(P)-binding domain-containing protein [Nocardioides sp.]|nr:NAD(P)-binding domain-containing protein [Nocardioides sp.]